MPARIPVTVATGFLGSGKTTLVNHILTAHHGKRIAVIENEYGEISVDNELVKHSQQTAEEIFELNNGCLCCTVRGDLVRILTKLLRRKNKFDAVLIETTGLANPAPIAQTFWVDDVLKEALQLDAILTVVDAKHILQHLNGANAKSEAVVQLAFADRILLNKLDLVIEAEKQTVLAAIKGINRQARVIECSLHNAAPDLDELLGLRAFDIDRLRVSDVNPVQEEAVSSHSHGHDHDHGDAGACEVCAEEHGHTHESGVGSVGIILDGDMHPEKLNHWLSRLLLEQGADIYRSKGVLAFYDSDQRHIFQGVHMMMEFGAGTAWGPEEKRSSRIIFIGKNLDREALTEGLQSCLVRRQ